MSLIRTWRRTLIEGERTALALEVRAIDPVWRLPELWRHEYLNILATYGRSGRLSQAQMQQLWSQGNRLLASCVSPVDLSLALQIAVEKSRISAYDAQFLALARRLGVICVTEDQVLRRKFAGVAVSMVEFCGRGR